MLNGLILAGGRSTRMGQDKSALAYHGQAQAQHLAALLAPFVGQVYLSVRAEQSAAPHLQGLPHILDCYDSPSPLNGIVSAMRAYPDADWLVVAVDMPHVDAHACATLLAQRDPQAVATCFESPAKGGPDPLLAIWERHGFARLQEKLLGQTAHICPRGALISLPTHIVKNAVAARILDNINTQAEWQALREEAV